MIDFRDDPRFAWLKVREEKLARETASRTMGSHSDLAEISAHGLQDRLRENPCDDASVDGQARLRIHELLQRVRR